MPSINKTLIILVRNILSSIMSILIHILSFHINPTLTRTSGEFQNISKLFCWEIFIAVQRLVVVGIVSRFSDVEIVRATFVRIIFHQEFVLTGLGPVVHRELVIVRLEEIVSVLGVPELQLGSLYLVSRESQLSLCWRGECWRWWRLIVRGPAGPRSGRTQLHHVGRPRGVGRGRLHGGEGGVVRQCDGVVVVGGGQDVVVVGEGDEGVVGTGETLHAVIVV